MVEVIVQILSQSSASWNFIYLADWAFFDTTGTKIPVLSVSGYGENGHTPVYGGVCRGVQLTILLIITTTLFFMRITQIMKV